MIQNQKDKLKKYYNLHADKVIFIGTNIVMAFIGFFKSYIIMKYLDFHNVGLIAMMQAIIDIVGMLQLGLLNGGFRMYFLNTNSVNRKINDLLFSYFTMLLIFALILFLIYGLYNDFSVNIILSLLACVAGILSLSKNWLSNLLIAEGNLRLLSIISFYSMLASLAFILIIPYNNLLGAALLIVTQPAFFLIYTFIKKKNYIPKGLYYKKTILRKLLKFGFVPFLVGLLVRFDSQIERWGIIKMFGFDELGKYNLVIIYSSLFILLPSSLTSIFFPKAIIHFKEKNIHSMNRVVRIFFFSWLVTS